MKSLQQVIGLIKPLDRVAMSTASTKIDSLLKPTGSLGRLELLAVQLAGIAGGNDINFDRKQIIVMAADHGVYNESVTISPRQVTALMASNMLRGTTGVCVLAKCAGATLLTVDVGIDGPTPDGVLDYKFGFGTGNIAKQPAMSREVAISLLEKTANLAMEQVASGIQLLGVGELGMANTTPAAAIVSVLCQTPPAEVVGLGANLPPALLKHKVAVVERAISCNQPDSEDGIDVLAKVGGFDLGGMAGVMLGAAAAGVPVVLDGFLSYAAALVACRIAPQVHGYLIPSHLSAEKGAKIALKHLGLRPYLDMEMRLGEGSGAALALPIIDAACAMMNDMGTLADAQIKLPVSH